MKKFRVEFNETGYYQGQGVWVCLDETAEVEAETAMQAVEFVKEWLEYDTPECNEYAWRAAELLDDNGHDLGDWELI